MSRFRRIAASFSCLALWIAMAAPAPAESQTVTGGQRDQQAGRVSKVDALTIKQSATAGFLKIGDIKGESTNDRHKGEIEILSWSWGASSTASRPRPSSGPGTLTITKVVDASSPRLAEASRNRRRFAQMTMTLPSPAPGESTTMTLVNVVVRSVQRSNEADGPVETISFNYERIQ